VILRVLEERAAPGMTMGLVNPDTAFARHMAHQTILMLLDRAHEADRLARLFLTAAAP
jgi:ABC-type polar amino acid transport system ATPase subunit